MSKSRKVLDYLGLTDSAAQRYGSGGPYEASIGYSRVVTSNGFAFTAGTTAIVDGELVGLDDAEVQTRVALELALAALKRAGFKDTSVVQSRLYVVDIRANSEAVGRAHAGIFGRIRPVATMVGVSELIDSRMLVEVELVAAKRTAGGAG
jgi:enamine deaminase RidA (YjgF/YER057c/UK114 family)